VDRNRSVRAPRRPGADHDLRHRRLRDLSSTRVIIENYAKANPQKVKAVNFQRAPAPELPAKIKAQQDAGRVDVNLLLVGQDAGSVLANNGQLIKLFPQYDTLFSREELTDAGKVLQ